MSKFDYLKKLDVAGVTATYTLSMISLDDGVSFPVLTVKPATDANKAFANEQLKAAKKNMTAYRAGAMNITMMDDTRDNDRKLYAKHVIVGWKNVVDDDGNEVPFSGEECLSFLEQLPNWVFDEVRNFCQNPQNFVDGVAVEAIAKNS